MGVGIESNDIWDGIPDPGPEPIDRLMGHSGQPGELGDTAYFLRKSLTQNIAYAAYYKPRTIRELAEDLGTAPAFIADEVETLLEYGFMIEPEDGRFQTNLIIWNTTAEQRRELYELYTDCALKITDLHFDALMDNRNQIEKSGIYCPDNDFNFLLWTLLPRNSEDQATRAFPLPINLDAVPLRKDGGHYIALATLDQQSDEDVGFDARYYAICGPMVRRRHNGLLLMAA